MSAYADTSFLFSMYVPDVHAAAAAATLSKTKPPLLITELGEFEFVNALNWRVFQKDLTLDEVRLVLNLFSSDANSGSLRVVPISAAVFDSAKQIARKHTPVLGARSLDVLHVASAAALRADVFYTFDRNQAKLATAIGLKTL